MDIPVGDVQTFVDHLVKCQDCDAMLGRDARYCSNCARNITAERAVVRVLVVVTLIIGLIATIGVVALRAVR